MSTEHLSMLRRRASIHAALGDPARLAIVDTLTLGDVSPGEIARLLGMPTNLIAHHVKVLRDEALVTRSRSEGDHRRTYLSLEPDTMAAIASPRWETPDRVVFVCTHNSALSQLAAALWRRRARRPAASAGTRPAPRVHPRTVKVARRHGLRLDPSRTSHIRDVIGEGDLVIAVCDNAYEDLTGDLRPRLHWSVPDPVRVDTEAAFEAAFTHLAARIDRVLPLLTSGGDHA
jgi:protein-tyrosine-phosphatase